MNCENCEKDKEELSVVTMSEAAWEKHETRHSKEKRNLLIWNIIATILLIGAIIFCWWRESQFETVETWEQEVWQDTDSGGNNNFVGGDVYGEAED